MVLVIFTLFVTILFFCYVYGADLGAGSKLYQIFTVFAEFVLVLRVLFIFLYLLLLIVFLFVLHLLIKIIITSFCESNTENNKYDG